MSDATPPSYETEPLSTFYEKCEDMKSIYTIKARETFICPICKWRVTEGRETRARTEMRFHMKYEHKVGGSRIKLTRP